MTRSLCCLLSALTVLAGACALAGDDAADDTDAVGEISSTGAWYHLDAASGLGPATVTVVNGYKVTCPDGTFAKTCHVTALVLPADCGWECQDGVLSLRGETLLRGRFDHGTLVVTTALDTYNHGLGASSIYQLTPASACTSDPCPGAVRAQKLNIASAPTTVTRVEFSHAVDPNYVLDPTRGDDQILSDPGLIVSGRIVAHVFRADRVWRLGTPNPACDPQLTARARAFDGENEVKQFRTLAEAERSTPTVEDAHQPWVVRIADDATIATFAQGRDDLWAQKITIAKSDCTVTVIAEH